MRYFRKLAILLTPCLLTGAFSSPAFAARRVKPIPEQLAAR
jgi:hypothetical protein